MRVAISAPALVPNLDSVEEFRLITNSFDAEYGKFSGAVMNAITKSGTNGFHGDVFWFLRNDAMDANELLRECGWSPEDPHCTAINLVACRGWADLERPAVLVR